MSEVAWVVPVHPPHFRRLAALVDGVRRHRLDVDLVAVTGTQDEADGLREVLDTQGLDVPQLVVAEQHVEQGRLPRYEADRSVINAKKLIGLSAVRERYRLLCTLDAETAVLGPGSVGESYRVRSQRRAWPAHRSHHSLIRSIVASPAHLFPASAAAHLLGPATADGTLYSWFEDVPTYEATILGDLLSYFGADGDLTAFCDRLRWEDFDHIVYQYFCVAELGWSLVDTGWPSCGEGGAYWEGWSLDSPQDRDTAVSFGIEWTPSWVHDAGLAIADVPSAFLAFHRDRG